MSEGPVDAKRELADWFSPGRFALMLALAFVATFWGVLTGTEGFYRSDYGVLGYPAMHWFREQFLSDGLPLWNPFSNCGAPFLAQWGTMCLYPGSAFLLWAPWPWALGAFSIGHLWLGGMGMYFLARDWTRNNVAAAFSGTAFAMSGAAMACLIWPNYCVGLGWMPWLVGCVQRTWTEGGVWTPCAILVGTMQMLVGVPELVLLTWLLIGVLWLCSVPKEKRAWHWTSLPLVAALVACLSAAQLIPFFDLLDQSQRDASFRDERWPMPIWGWANLFVPLFHYGRTDQGVLMQQGQFFLASYYLGLAVMGFAFLGLWKQRERRVWILGGATLLALMLALGKKGFVYSLLVDLFPGGGIARYPIKFVLLAAFAIPLLAGYGVAHFLAQTENKSESRFRELASVIIAVVAEVFILLVLAHGLKNQFDLMPEVRSNTSGRLILYGLLIIAFLKGANPEIAVKLRKIYLTLALAFLAMDLASHLPGQNPTLSAGMFHHDLVEEERDTLSPMLGAGRVMISPEAEKVLLFSKVKDPAQDWLGKRLAWWSNLNLLEGVPKVNGSMTLRMARQDELERGLYPKDGEAPDAEGLKDFLSVTHITSAESAVTWTNRHSAMIWISAGQKTVVGEPGAALEKLLSDEFDPREVVFLENDGSVSEETNRGRATVSIQSAQSDRFACEVDAAEATVVVFAQSYNSNWRATVNDQPETILHANHAFQAVRVPAGKSSVVFQYEEPGLMLGGRISLPTLILIIVWLVMAGRRAGRSPSPAANHEG
ncbi:MAG: hypothetical protein CMO80_04535 [Verrucomicrobiales bacterium]|nr:hypothetical protein [Verrucomicrobiales bacterium]|tara:strand:+ start:29 stop:2335 length:2307 start_codon:yes stop_codon:yes gene_type:complete